MALLNKAVVCGAVLSASYKKGGGKTEEAVIRLSSLCRNPKTGEEINTAFSISTTDPDQIRMLKKEHIAEGDIVCAMGRLGCAEHQKTAACKNCGNENTNDCETVFIVPDSIRIIPVFPKEEAGIFFQEEVLEMDDKSIEKQLKERSPFKDGRVIHWEEPKTYGRQYMVHVWYQEMPDQKTLDAELRKTINANNSITLLGTVKDAAADCGDMLLTLDTDDGSFRVRTEASDKICIGSLVLAEGILTEEKGRPFKCSCRNCGADYTAFLPYYEITASKCAVIQTGDEKEAHVPAEKTDAEKSVQQPYRVIFDDSGMLRHMVNNKTDNAVFYSCSDIHFHPVSINPWKAPKGMEQKKWNGVAVMELIDAAGFGIDEKAGLSGTVDAIFKGTVFDSESDGREHDVTMHKIFKTLQAQLGNFRGNMRTMPAAEKEQVGTLRLMECLEKFADQESYEYRMFSAETDWNAVDSKATGTGLDELLKSGKTIIIEMTDMDPVLHQFIQRMMVHAFRHVEQSTGIACIISENK